MKHRIAMWSGPRNISTAMMRSWGSRPDTIVCDEPLYAHYLAKTGLEHPGHVEIIEHHDADWRSVVDWLTGPLPNPGAEGITCFYQKHMAHHLLPGVGREWLNEVTNGFLIRDPREMITSLMKVIPEPRLEDTGLPQQVEIFEMIRDQTGTTPPVLDSKDVLDNPRMLLGKLCDALGLPFDEAMLSWAPGRRDTDGIWAKHWYGAVEKSTCFNPYSPKGDPVPPHLQSVYDESLPLYEKLYQHRLT
ncbi:MAG: HAD family hydrolase [Planctomycetota bacterium]|nr:HAD family hydrolase [Planctomycetota bacterium]